MKIEGQSKGLHTSWFFSPEYHFMMDAGEGCSTALSTRIFGLNHIFLTHSHVDHISGLHGLLALRERCRTESALMSPSVPPPMTIYFPKDTPVIRDFQKYLESKKKAYSVEWVEMTPGQEVKLGGNLIVDAFPTIHYHPNSTFNSLGYSVFRKGTKLRPEFRHLSGPEIAKLKKDGLSDDKLQYETRQNLLVYTGDTLPLDPKKMAPYWENAEVILHDATFLNPTDRGTARHCTAEEAEKVMEVAKPKRLIGCHVSPRIEYAKNWKGILAKYPQLELINPFKEFSFGKQEPIIEQDIAELDMH